MVFKVGLIDEKETVKDIEMIDLRLKSERAYQEEVAEEIYQQIGDYWKLMDEICRRIIEKIESDFWSKPEENKNKVAKSNLISFLFLEAATEFFFSFSRSGFSCFNRTEARGMTGLKYY
jgi:hypothetical protein